MKSDMKLSGSGSIVEGEYENISVSGSVKILGNIKARDIKISGSVKGEGSIHSNSLSVSGSMHINGGTEVEENIKISGSAKIGGVVKAKNIKTSGALNINNDVNFEEMKCSGSLYVNGNCEGSSINICGQSNISELLSADNIKIVLEGNSSIKEIGGANIKIQRNSNNGILKIFSFMKDKYLEAEVIEGDNIYLEYTNCKVVRGKNITIGPKCKIDKVEYGDNLEVDGNSVVGERVCVKN
ncbi:cell shape determination protein CcmA [uncultured Clostridium sp.]|uniref:cell shape determination protein CcmA n=1 Tax=uncultured Clostridium sp. TaxID=59620 RepID=UPI0025D63849|nr:cell shape determination protein CcmA [uncultured Clostridium sp.]